MDAAIQKLQALKLELASKQKVVLSLQWPAPVSWQAKRNKLVTTYRHLRKPLERRLHRTKRHFVRKW